MENSTENSTLDGAMLGSHLAFRVTVVTDGPVDALHASRNIRNILQTAGHVVNVVSLPNTPGTNTPTNVVDSAPDVLLLDTQQSLPQLEELATQVRVLPDLNGVPVLAVLPGNYKAGHLTGEAWNTLRTAGADDFIVTRASEAEVLARIELLVRFARLRQDLVTARQQLSRSQQYDELTQLLNRRFFFQAAHREWARARRYNHHISCLMLEVNYLRLYNTTLGFSCGDYILRAVANIIRQWTRDSDIVARFSEERFVIILPETNVEGAVALRENLLNVIAQTEFIWQQQKLPVTISIGESERIAFKQETAEADTEAATGEEDPESMSVREEMADILAAAAAALNVARKGARYPALNIDSTPGILARSVEDEHDESLI